MTIGVLMIHGFSGGTYEIQPFADYIAARTDWVIDMPTLPGHGEALSLKGYKATDWLMTAEIAYRSLAKQVDEIIIVGFSMGGMIALYLAKRYKVKKLVLLSAAAKYVSPSQLVRDLRDVADDAIHGSLKNNVLFQRYAFKLKHVPFSATVEFMKIVRLVEPYISHIKIPVYIVQGELDGIVPKATAHYLMEHISSAEKYVYLSTGGKHHICYSEDCDSWFSEVMKFLCKV
ncbi:alpha/beta hydrolase [Solibacillus sp. FSL H8-0538]|uniref:alpha/beta hydrolase n=1 Tax=Solibacillus sp. FSL H8-0538 TaxID=2921400 RepID=UPI0030F59ADD